MKLVILSNMAHYKRGDRIVGHGPTAREIDHLATLFDEVVHVGCLHDEAAPSSSTPYSAANVRLRGVPPAGGETLRDKLRILRLYPHYARVMWQELKHADAVHVRCPANVSLLAVLLLAMRRKPVTRWIKYAGNWEGYQGESWSYRFQRWLLRKGIARAAVSENGKWPNQPPFVHAFLNPCLTESELELGNTIAMQKRLSDPVRLVFVGGLAQAKGVDRAIEIVRELKTRGVPCTLEVIGEGAERDALENLATHLDVQHEVRFHGGVPRPLLGEHYAKAHFILLPSRSEGWPKVLSEAMAYGVLPLASRVGSIPQYLADFGAGRALDAHDTRGFADAVIDYRNDPDRWHRESTRGARAMRTFSYTAYLEAVQKLLQNPRVSSAEVELWPVVQ